MTPGKELPKSSAGNLGCISAVSRAGRTGGEVLVLDALKKIIFQKILGVKLADST